MEPWDKDVTRAGLWRRLFKFGESQVILTWESLRFASKRKKNEMGSTKTQIQGIPISTY